MCGIVGYAGNRDALAIIIGGLESLEYRGYDSAGVSVYEGGKIETTRATGKLSELKRVLEGKKRSGTASLGIGHTRWATHGRPTETNAHPHTAGRVSLIHNGIIENYLPLRAMLESKGCTFLSETDTEVAAHLLNTLLGEGLEPIDAMRRMCAQVKGSYAFLAIDSRHPDRVLVAKNSTPIIIGKGDGENLIASDIPAVLQHTRRVIILEDGDLAQISADSVYIENQGKEVLRKEETIAWDPITAQKGGFKHFMLKEIYDQSRVIGDTLRGRISEHDASVKLPELEGLRDKAASIKRIVMVACGTAWHACLEGKFFIEEFAGIPCDVDYASEFRYRSGLVDKDTLVIAVSQSGETLDTLGALESAIGKGPTLAICNVVGASICRKAEMVVYTHAGPEISVASTKAFTTQLVALQLLALFLAEARGSMSAAARRHVLHAMVELPAALSQTLKVDGDVATVAKKFFQARDFLFLGRGRCYPIALEGALKLKEISYIHAEGYPAAEMKHGPIALIDENMPVVVIATKGSILEKTISNIQEVKARKGVIIAIVTEGDTEVKTMADYVIEIPDTEEALVPLLATIPLQLLSYHIAIMRGCNVDQPRNLAKSVTVE